MGGFTLEPSGIHPNEQIVRVDGRAVGRIRRFSNGWTGTTITTNTVVASDVDKSTAIQMVLSDHREFEAYEREQESLDQALERDRASYRDAAGEE